MKIPILTEDDCAPDAREFFDKDFLKMMGISRADFTKAAKDVSGVDSFEYRLGVYHLGLYFDHQHWTLSICTPDDSPILLLTYSGCNGAVPEDRWSTHDEMAPALAAYHQAIADDVDIASLALVLKSTDYTPFHPALYTR
jgi:hypothetical protein